jgi:hypothetical protein
VNEWVVVIRKFELEFIAEVEREIDALKARQSKIFCHIARVQYLPMFMAILHKKLVDEPVKSLPDILSILFHETSLPRVTIFYRWPKETARVIIPDLSRRRFDFANASGDQLLGEGKRLPDVLWRVLGPADGVVTSDDLADERALVSSMR